MPWTATSVPDTIAALKVEPVIVIDESNTCRPAQASARAPAHHRLTATGAAISDAISALGAAITTPEPPATARQWTPRRGCRRPARENLDATTLTDNTGADDMVRIEPQRLAAASAPAPTAPDPLDLVPHRVSSNPPRVWESPHGASTPPTRSPMPAAAPSSNPDRTSMTRWCAHRRAGHHRALHRPAGRHRVRGRGARPHKVGEHPHPPAVSTPTRVPGRHSHPRAGGSRRPDPASTPAGRHRLTVHPAGRPAMCSSGCRRMRIKPAHRLPRPPPSAPAAQRRSGRLPTAAPGNHPAGQHRTRCSPRHRRRQAAGRYPLPGWCINNNGDGLSLTQQLRRRGERRRPGCWRCRPRDGATSAAGRSRPGAAVTAVTAAAVGSTVGVATTPRPRRRRYQRHWCRRC